MALGGKRPGAGRKKGSKKPETLERERILAAFRQRAMQAADVLFNAQLSLARGQQFLYKITKKRVVGPKGGIHYESQKPKLVTSQWEIEALLEHRVESGDMHDSADPSATYYFLTTKEPDNKAIDSLLDRSLGKPAQPLSGPDGGPMEFVDATQKAAAEKAIATYLHDNQGKLSQVTTRSSCGRLSNSRARRPTTRFS